MQNLCLTCLQVCPHITLQSRVNQCTVATSHCMTYKCHIFVMQVPDKVIGVVAICDLMTQACLEREACLIQEAKAKEEDHGYDGDNAHLAEVLVKR